MKLSKNFLFVIVLVSVVVAIALAAAIHAARERGPEERPSTVQGSGIRPLLLNSILDGSGSNGTPSAAAQKRAKDFNDATNRFNAPDDPPR